MKFRDVLIGIGIIAIAISFTALLCGVVYLFCEWAMQSIGAF